MIECAGFLGNPEMPTFKHLGVTDRENCSRLFDVLLQNSDEPLPTELIEQIRSVLGRLGTRWGNQRDGLPPVPVRPAPAFVRRLVTEYIKAKLNNELQSWRVTIPISDFFDLGPGRCELEECTLLAWTAEAQ